MYDHYAQFYDSTGQLRYSLLFAQYLQELLAAHPLPPQQHEQRRALDLACGTGTFALLLADDGWQATGLDRSAAMIAQARQKALSLGLPLDLREGDLQALPQWAQPFDLATCLYDSLNYLLDVADLAACFAGVAAALRPGGLFVADMNSRHVLQHVWVGTEVLEQPSYTQLSRIAFDAGSDRSALHLTGFVGDDAGGYTRFDEQHTQQAYDPGVVTALLEAAGLRVEGCYDAFTLAAPGPASPRFVWVARAS